MAKWLVQYLTVNEERSRDPNPVLSDFRALIIFNLFSFLGLHLSGLTF